MHKIRNNICSDKCPTIMGHGRSILLLVRPRYVYTVYISALDTVVVNSKMITNFEFLLLFNRHPGEM